MDLRTATINCIERMPDTDESERVLKHIYAMAKKAGKETRCAPKRRKLETHLSEMREEMIGIMIRDRASR